MGLVCAAISCGGVSDDAPSENSAGTSSAGSGSAGVGTTDGGSSPITGGSGGSAGAGATCNCENETHGAQQALECECTDDCPTEEELVLAWIEMSVDSSTICHGSGPSRRDVLITSGCGVRAVQLSHYSRDGVEYFFDESTGELLGVLRWSDAPYGACRDAGVGRYMYGDVPAECPEAVVCNACPDPSGSMFSQQPCE
jgi:hypothetical protein